MVIFYFIKSSTEIEFLLFLYYNQILRGNIEYIILFSFKSINNTEIIVVRMISQYELFVLI